MFCGVHADVANTLRQKLATSGKLACNTETYSLLKVLCGAGTSDEDLDFLSLQDWKSQKNTGSSCKYVRYALCGLNVMGLVLLDPQHTSLTDDKTRLKEGTVSGARK